MEKREREFKNGEWTHSIRSLELFKTSWDWLILAVKKIAQLEEQGLIEEDIDQLLKDRFNPFLHDIDTVYANVVSFVKWYKKH